jgi:hypothetical protein
MSQLVDHLAELTGFRDRDVLDTTMASALRDLLRPRSVTVYRCVGASDAAAAQYWITRSRLTGGDAAATSDSAFIDLEQLPALHASPERARCLHEQIVLALSGPPITTMFPLVTDRGAVGVVEIETERPLDADAQRLVASILRIVSPGQPRAGERRRRCRTTPRRLPATALARRRRHRPLQAGQ